jgi:pimeloyl-ACP methyl ester carboxylesterase
LFNFRQYLSGSQDVVGLSQPNSIEHVYLYVDGMRVHYQVAGPVDAPPLILLHGIGGNVNWWQENMGAFSQHFRTYALDLPGFGQTWRLRQRVTIEAKAAFVQRWMGWLGIERASFLGHSMGGQVAIRVAARYPELVVRLIAAAPSGLWLSLAERLRWAREMPKVWVPLHQTLTIATGTLRTDLLALSLSLWAILADRDAPTSLQALLAPTLLLWGQADGVVPPALGPRTLALIQNAPVRLEYIERGTHNAMFDQANRFNQLVLQFLLESSVAKL